MRGLPLDIRQQWCRRTDEDGIDRNNLFELFQHIYHHITQLDCAQRYRKVTNPTGSKICKNYNSNSENSGYLTDSAASALCTADNIVCNNCKRAGHEFSNCYRFNNLTKDACVKRVKALKLCLKCFKPHPTNRCKHKCSNCKRNHHVLLCTPPHSNINPQASGSPTVASQNNSRTTPAPSRTDYTPGINTAAVMVAEQSDRENVNMCQVDGGFNATTVLMTAQVKVIVNDKSYAATVLLDTGGDRTYVSSDFVNKTKPTVIGKQNTSYSAFGDTKISRVKLTQIFSIDLVESKQ